MMGIPGATGSHQALIRHIRITNSSGVTLLRLFTGTETRLVTATPTLTNYASGGTGFGNGSLGTAYTFDTTKRRWDGKASNRFLRAKMTFYNKTDLTGVYVTMQQAGTE
jgi:hypothetical protein